MKKSSKKIKLSNNTLVLLGIISLFLWFYGLYLLIKHWDHISKTAAVLASLGLLSGFSPLTIVIVLATDKEDDKKEKYSPQRSRDL